MTVSSMPRVSVVMPVYNSERYLAEAVRSVLCQTYSDFELIIVDDGSADRSLAIATEFAGGDRRVRVFPREHGGVSVAINSGVAQAMGGYIARADSDDVQFPNRLERQVKYLESHPGIGLVSSGFIITDANLKPMETLYGITSDWLIRLSLGIFNPIVGSAIFKRSLFDKAGGYNTRASYAEDYDLWCRMAPYTKFHNLREPLFYYRWHGESSSVSHNKRAQITSRIGGAMIRQWVTGKEVVYNEEVPSLYRYVNQSLYYTLGMLLYLYCCRATPQWLIKRIRQKLSDIRG